MRSLKGMLPILFQSLNCKPAYCKFLTTPKYRILFSKARLDVLPPELTGRFSEIPFSEQLCDFTSGNLDTIWHFFIDCNKYSTTRDKWICVYIQKWNPAVKQEIVAKLLADTDPNETLAVAKFLSMAFSNITS